MEQILALLIAMVLLLLTFVHKGVAYHQLII